MLGVECARDQEIHSVKGRVEESGGATPSYCSSLSYNRWSPKHDFGCDGTWAREIDAGARAPRQAAHESRRGLPAGCDSICSCARRSPVTTICRPAAGGKLLIAVTNVPPEELVADGYTHMRSGGRGQTRSAPLLRCLQVIVTQEMQRCRKEISSPKTSIDAGEGGCAAPGEIPTLLQLMSSGPPIDALSISIRVSVTSSTAQERDDDDGGGLVGEVHH